MLEFSDGSNVSPERVTHKEGQGGALPWFIKLFLKWNGFVLLVCLSDQLKEDKKWWFGWSDRP